VVHEYDLRVYQVWRVAYDLEALRNRDSVDYTLGELVPGKLDLGVVLNQVNITQFRCVAERNREVAEGQGNGEAFENREIGGCGELKPSREVLSEKKVDISPLPGPFANEFEQ
jgi:hypothetical protein